MYQDIISATFKQHSKALSTLTVDEFNEIVTKEQRGYLDDMQIPPGIAKNTALLENVFVVMVCILNRIPIFVVGKPGMYPLHITSFFVLFIYKQAAVNLCLCS